MSCSASNITRLDAALHRNIRPLEHRHLELTRVVASFSSASHDGPIHGLSWAHPSFGSILASCSFDGKVFIWKENEGPQKGWSKVKEHLLHTASGQSGNGAMWERKGAQLTRHHPQ